MSYNAQLDTITDTRPLDPPEYWLDDRDPVEKTLIVSGSHGDRVPQVFCWEREKIEIVDREDWEICRSGPEHEGYWDAWGEVLNSWEYEEYDYSYSLFKVYLEYDYKSKNLYECREFIRNDAD